MDLEAEVSKLMNRADRAACRPVVWSAIGSFAIEPPERFHAHMVNKIIEPENRPGDAYVRAEIMHLRRLNMVNRLQKVETDKVVWYARTNAKAWDIASPYLLVNPVETEKDWQISDQKIADLLTKPRTIALPDPVDDRINQLVQKVREAGDVTTRKEVVAAVIAFSVDNGQDMSDLLHQYRRATVGQVLLP
jgi:hypothetical protein